MGVASSTNSVDTMLSEYKIDDINSFIQIAKHVKDNDSNKKFYAWKIGCLYRFLINLPEYTHDIGYLSSEIITKYKDLGCSIDTATIEGLRIAGCT